LGLRRRLQRVEQRRRPAEETTYDPGVYEDEEEARKEMDRLLREAFGREPSEDEARRFLTELISSPVGAPMPDPSEWPRDRAFK